MFSMISKSTKYVQRLDAVTGWKDNRRRTARY
jgi:hypothetical protein